jgi:hypothetical protein
VEDWYKAIGIEGFKTEHRSILAQRECTFSKGKRDEQLFEQEATAVIRPLMRDIQLPAVCCGLEQETE